MLGGLINGLIIAEILSWFNVDQIFIDVLQPFTDITLVDSHFYFTLALIGLICGAIGKY